MTFYKRDTIQKYIEPFQQWLSTRGAEVMPPKNGTEIVRFRSGGQWHIITTSPAGKLHYSGESELIFHLFRNNGTWRACPSTGKVPSHLKGSRMHAIRQRDGDLCFFCQELVSFEEQSEEHLCARTFGGPNHLANIVLAHVKCNALADHLSAAEKIAIHVHAKFGKLQSYIADLEQILKTQIEELPEVRESDLPKDGLIPMEK